MQTETITVQYVNPPKNNPNFGSIKTSTGEYISVPSNRLHEFAQNGTYAIDIEMNGRFKNFKDFANPGAVPPPQQAPLVAYAPTAATPPPRNTPIMDTEAHKSENMAVMGIIGRCVHGTGTIPPVSVLEDMMRSIRHAWRESQKDKPAQTHSEPGFPGDQGLPEQRGIPGDDWQQ